MVIFGKFLYSVKERNSVVFIQVLSMEINGQYGMIMEFIVYVMCCLKLRVVSRIIMKYKLLVKIT